MSTTSAPMPSTPTPEEPADDGPRELALAAALYVHGAELVNLAGHLTEQVSRDGTMSAFLRVDISRSVSRLAEALREYLQTRRA